MPIYQTSLPIHYPSPAQIDRVRGHFDSITLGTLLASREEVAKVLTRSRKTKGLPQSMRPNLTQLLVAAAAASLNNELGGFTQPLTCTITNFPPSSIKGVFDLCVERELFVFNPDERAALKPVKGSGGERRAQIYHATEVGTSIFRLFDPTTTTTTQASPTLQPARTSLG